MPANLLPQSRAKHEHYARLLKLPRLIDTTLRHQRDTAVCARVEPSSRCFCGFTFVEHPAEARLGGTSGDGFA